MMRAETTYLQTGATERGQDSRRRDREEVDIKFKATIRYWRPEQESGLAVANLASEHIARLGGLKQMRVQGTINDAEYESNVVPAGSGRLALSVSQKIQKMMKAAGVGVGDDAEFELERIPARRKLGASHPPDARQSHRPPYLLPGTRWPIGQTASQRPPFGVLSPCSVSGGMKTTSPGARWATPCAPCSSTSPSTMMNASGSPG
jgi:uncharacterized protein DUF1905